MAFKRALWTSGYAYRINCPYCGTAIEYRDRQLDYRPWYPNGFVYCPRCRKPLRHSEIYAVHPDGSPVYATVAEAEQAIRQGYYGSMAGAPPSAPPQSAPPPAAQPSAGDKAVAYCTRCGRRYVVGEDRFCAGCGHKLDPDA